MEYFIAIDSGGSKCDSLLLSEDGTVHGFSRFEQNGISGRSEKAIIESVHSAMRNMVPEKISVITYVEKYHPLFQHLGFRIFPNSTDSARQRSIRMIITKESYSELAICGLKSGIVLLSGTGAFVYARNNDGKECHYDGLGPILGDDGSGYYIGLRAFRAAVRTHWHPRRETVLRDKVFAHLGISAVWDAVRISLARHDRVVIASLAKVAIVEAEKGDKVATAIIKEAAAAVCETVYDVIEALGMTDGKYVLMGLGGVVTGSKIYWDEIASNVLLMAPNIECRIEKRPLVIGVAVSGMRDVLNLDESKTHELADKVSRSYYEFIKNKETK